MNERLKKYGIYIFLLLLVIILGMNIFVTNKIKVSVIVPVYNTEKYLEQCLSSLEKTSSKNVEFIVINDGSTDNSLSIMQNFAKRDKRFKIYSQDNKGVGYTRNRGIDLAKGEYVGFVDSDDFVSRDYFVRLYNKAKKYDADMAVSTHVLKISNRYVASMLLDSWKYYHNEYIEDFSFMVGKGAQVWDKIYKKSFLINNNLRFYKERIWFEDEWFSTLVASYAKRIAIEDNVLYYYRYRDNGLSASYNSNDYNFNLGLHFYCNLIKEVFEKTNRDDLKNKMLDKVMWYIQVYNPRLDYKTFFEKFKISCKI